MTQALLLVGHGSRDTEGTAEFLAFAERVKAVAGDQILEHGFIELAEPDVQTGIDRCVSQGASHIVVLPIILLAANHSKIDIPGFLDVARQRHPGVTFTYGRVPGVSAAMTDVLNDRFADVEAAHGPFDRTDTALVLVGRGSSDPDANSDVAKLARLLAERQQIQLVDFCYMGVTFPSLQTVVRRVARSGVRRIVVMPYLLFTGVLGRRVERWVAELQAEFPEVALYLGGYLGDHENVTQLVLAHKAEAVSGTAVMNCSLCRFRLAPAAGGEHHHHHHHQHHQAGEGR